jgi:predicted PolB exonuclease-like 3'-5' exonuclease
MFRTVKDHLWAFDVEWVPDPKAGRVLYDLPPDLSDADVMAEMWKRNGATEENKFPFLKTALCRVVSIAAVQRKVRGADVELNLLWLPRNTDDPEQCDERTIIGTFLQAVGRHRPQIVGFNSHGSDLRILVQRGVILGLSQPEFCVRPEKPWEDGDYFAAKNNETSVDLMEIVGGWGTRAVSLHEVAKLSGIPGKFETQGEQVAHLWLAGKWREIVQYNCFDALTTYLLWLRVANFAGRFNAQTYEDEQENVRQLIMSLADKVEGDYLTRYFDEWERLHALANHRPA